MVRVYFIDLEGVRFAHRDFLNEKLAQAYMAGMKSSLPDIKMTLEGE